MREGGRKRHGMALAGDEIPLFICISVLFRTRRGTTRAPLRLQCNCKGTDRRRPGIEHVIVEIVILAMIAAFLGLRLYSVLGQRAEHEEKPVPHRFDQADEKERDVSAKQAKPASAATPVRIQQLQGAMPAVERGVRAIVAADPRFDITAFLEGAKGAYEMVLEAFWKGDKETLRELCDDDVYASFAGAIDGREAAGHTLDNKLIRIEENRIRSAELDGRTARIAVLFISDIAAVTRDSDGQMIAGSLDDAIESRDIWTFSRNVDAADPNWVLDETDEG